MSNTIVIFVIILVVLVAAVIWFRKRKAKNGSKVFMQDDIAPNNKVYIGNLAYRTSPRLLRQHFSQYGEVKHVKIIRDAHTGKSKGYAFMSFSSNKEAEKSLDANGYEFFGRGIVVRIAKEKH